MNKYLFALVTIILFTGFLFQFSPNAQAFQLLDIEKGIEIRENKEISSKGYFQNKKSPVDVDLPFSSACLNLSSYADINIAASPYRSLLISSHKLFIHSPPFSL